MVREVFGVEPYPDQIELLEAYDRRERRIAKKSGHGVGKTTGLAWIIIHHLLTRFPQKTVCTAPTTSQLFDALAAEVKAWITHLPPNLQALLEVKSDRIELKHAPDESFVSFRTSRPEVPEALAGVHSQNVLLIADEASGIPEPIFEAAVGSMSGANATTILAGNPVRTSGLFFNIWHKKELAEKWVRMTVSCVNHPNVDPDFVDEVRSRYGERSNAYRVRVLGEFPLADDDKIIPFELIEAAKLRDVRASPSAAVVWGVDVARFGSDDSALAKRKGNVLLERVKIWHGLDLMELAGRIKLEYDTTPENLRPAEINIDSIGLGAGVVDRLRELGLPARGINVAESPALKGTYNNQRTELWFKGKDWFTERNCEIANDEELGEELAAQTYGLLPSGKLAAKPKDDVKLVLGRSPNRADAFLLTLASEAVIAQQGMRAGSSWAKPLRRMISGLVALLFMLGCVSTEPPRPRTPEDVVQIRPVLYGYLAEGVDTVIAGAHALPHETAYCVNEFLVTRYPAEVVVTVTKLVLAQVDSADAENVWGIKCESEWFHSHPAARDCNPSAVDWIEMARYGTLFGGIICHDRTVRFYWQHENPFRRVGPASE